MTISKASQSKVQYTTPITDLPDGPTLSATNVGTSRAFNNGSATITATPAETGGGSITSYTVTSSPGGYTGSGASPVTVTGLQSNTSYTFTATATNAQGTSPFSGPASNSITATTVPDVPTIGTATRVSDTVASITFTPPANTGGSSITSYVIESSPSVAITTEAGTTSPLTATATFLGSSQSYTFTIKAVNANGAGEASSASDGLILKTTPDTAGFGGTYAQLGGYNIHTFNESSDYTVNSSHTADVLIVGGGGNRNGSNGGGGGGGGYRYFTGMNLNTKGTLPVIVGAAGSDSSFNGYTATRGGSGGSYMANGQSGGSGGGGGQGGTSGGGPTFNPSSTHSGGAGNTPSTSPSQGNSGGGGAGRFTNPGAGGRFDGGGGGGGGAGGGGGGVAPTSTTAGSGGAGISNSITGTSVTYSRGGGGKAFYGFGGIDGSPSDAAAANTGGGGAGGGSGIVVIRYPV